MAQDTEKDCFVITEVGSTWPWVCSSVAEVNKRMQCVYKKAHRRYCHFNIWSTIVDEDGTHIAYLGFSYSGPGSEYSPEPRPLVL